MVPFLNDWLARQPAAGWQDLAGARADLRLPLRQALVNAAIEALVLPRIAALRRLTVSFHAGQRVDVVAASAAFSFLPAITIPLELDPVVAFDPTPRIRLQILRTGVAGALTPLISLFAGSLPPGVVITDRLVEVDVATLAAGHDTLGLLRFLRSARLETEPGTLWLSGQADI